MCGLAQEVQIERLARAADRGLEVPTGLGVIGQAAEHLGQATAMVVLGPERPLVGEVGEKRTRRQRHRPVQARRVVGRSEAGEPLRVDVSGKVGRDPGRRAAGPEIGAAAARVERDAECPERASKRRPRARVEHVRPEGAREPGARVVAGMKQEVGEERPWLETGNRGQRAAIDLHREPAEEPCAQHAASWAAPPPASMRSKAI